MTDMIVRPGQTDIVVAGDRLHDWGQAATDWESNFISDQTRRAYLGTWQAFLEWAQVAPSAVTQSDIIAYRRYMESTPSKRTGRPLSQATVNRHLSALSSFFDFAVERGLVDVNPVDGVKRRNVDPYGRATWLDPEARQDIKLLQAIDTKTTQGLRDRAIMLLMLTRGLRVASVAALKVGDIRRQGDRVFLTYTRKRDKTKEVRLPGLTAKAIDDYLTTRSGLDPSSPLFVATEEGRQAARSLGQDPVDATPLTDRAIAYLIRSYGNKAFGPGHGISPHSLRHTAAMTAIHEGLAVTDISDLLDHASLRVTTVYLHATNQAGNRAADALAGRYAAMGAQS